MANTSAAVRNRWNNQNYDKINITVPKGLRKQIQTLAEARKMTVNSLINQLLIRKLEIPAEDWGRIIMNEREMEV